jgi:hypothetical protein
MDTELRQRLFQAQRDNQLEAGMTVWIEYERGVPKTSRDAAGRCLKVVGQWPNYSVTSHLRSHVF